MRLDWVADPHQVPEFCAEPVTSSAIGGWLRRRGIAGGDAARRIWISLGLSSLSSEKGDDQVLQQERLGEDVTGLVATAIASKQQVQQGRKGLIVMLLAQQDDGRYAYRVSPLSLSMTWSTGGEQPYRWLGKSWEQMSSIQDTSTVDKR
jgi:hypothetical protein